MNRDIKFRAWVVSDKCMIQHREVIERAHLQFQDSLNDRDIVMQYTGLKDKNGKDRYFDDIVKVTWRKDTDSYLQQGDDYVEKEFIARIDWHIDRIVYVLANGKKLNHPSNAEFEIIGNIYENSDLLK